MNLKSHILRGKVSGSKILQDLSHGHHRYLYQIPQRTVIDGFISVVVVGMVL